jgi:hypothetical protein
LEVVKAYDALPKRKYTWDAAKTSDLSLALNVSLDLETEGWLVCLESPVKGVQRNYRIPVFGFKENAALVLKPVIDPKKVNVSGLKMLEIKYALEQEMPSVEIRAVVYAFMPEYEDSRKTSYDYELWLRG